MTHRIKPLVGDTPKFGAVRFALPIGDTREDMRNWLQKSEVGQSLYNCGDCVLVWANEGDLFIQHRPTDPLADALKIPEIMALVDAVNVTTIIAHALDDGYIDEKVEDQFRSALDEINTALGPIYAKLAALTKEGG